MMTDIEYEKILEELDHLLNDYDAPLEPDRVWTLLAEVAQHDMEPSGQIGGRAP